MKHGDWAWLVLGGGVCAYEAYAALGQAELLSQAVDRYRRRRPLITNLTIVYVAAHLMRRWPARLDPLHQLATKAGR